jgi:hypothetical protein
MVYVTFTSQCINSGTSVDFTQEYVSILRRIFGPKRDEATGEWRRLHTE